MQNEIKLYVEILCCFKSLNQTVYLTAGIITEISMYGILIKANYGIHRTLLKIQMNEIYSKAISLQKLYYVVAKEVFADGKL